MASASCNLRNIGPHLSQSLSRNLTDFVSYNKPNVDSVVNSVSRISLTEILYKFRTIIKW